MNERAHYTPSNEIRPIRCEKCGGEAVLVWRSPDDLKDGLEVWTFRCSRCRHTVEHFEKR